MILLRIRGLLSCYDLVKNTCLDYILTAKKAKNIAKDAEDAAETVDKITQDVETLVVDSNEQSVGER